MRLHRNHDPLQLHVEDGRRTRVFDLNEFALGAETPESRAGLHNWRGGFRGRPSLIGELLSPITAYLSGPNATTQINLVRVSLRSLWRFLDTLDTVASVDQLADITDVHGSLWIGEVTSVSNYRICRALIASARRASGLPDLLWPPLPSASSRARDIPDQPVLRALYHELRSDVRETLDRWEESSRLRTQTSDDLFPTTECERRQTAAFFEQCERLSDPFPAFDDLPAEARPRERRREYLSRFYPLRADLHRFLWLILLQTPWNTQVAIDIDLTLPDWCVPHPTAPGLYVIKSYKTRSHSQQIAISASDSAFRPYRLLQALLAATAPVRTRARHLLTQLEASLRDDPSSPLNPDLIRLRYLVKSPWLCYDGSAPNDIGALYPDDSDLQREWKKFLRNVSERRDARHARATQKHAGLQLSIPVKIPSTLRVSDLRDAYLSFVYEKAGYHWFATQLAAGHGDINSLKHYLRNKQWRRHSEHQVATLQHHFWSEVEARRVVDPAILRGLVERGVITADQRKRWQEKKDRTAMGMGCIDFTNPPSEIAPNHIPGTGCRVQRCTLCSHGILFPDSADPLTRRQAELEWLRTDMPLVSWEESQFPEELDVLKANLAQFDPRVVAERKTFWANEISSGRHRPMLFDGEYE